MKKLSLVAAMLLLVLAPAVSVAAATSLRIQLSGRILLQVQDRGRAWYVDPTTRMRIYLGRPEDAFNIMKSLGLGVRNSDLARIAKPDQKHIDEAFARRMSGRILLQIESHGEAWYVNPVNFRRYYLGRPADAFRVMRGFGLGITNANLSQIPVDRNYEQEYPVPEARQYNLNILNFAFSPQSITIHKGDSVIWTNNDTTTHRIMADTFNSTTLLPGQSYSHIFGTAGTFDYICSVHPSMTGRVIVQ